MDEVGERGLQTFTLLQINSLFIRRMTRTMRMAERKMSGKRYD